MLILNVSTLKSIQLGKTMHCFLKNHALIQYSFIVQNRPTDSYATDLEIFSYSFKFHIAKYYLWSLTLCSFSVVSKMSSHNYLRMLFKILPLPIFVWGWIFFIYFNQKTIKYRSRYPNTSVFSWGIQEKNVNFWKNVKSRRLTSHYTISFLKIETFH